MLQVPFDFCFVSNFYFFTGNTSENVTGIYHCTPVYHHIVYTATGEKQHTYFLTFPEAAVLESALENYL